MGKKSVARRKWGTSGWTSQGRKNILAKMLGATVPESIAFIGRLAVAPSDTAVAALDEFYAGLRAYSLTGKIKMLKVPSTAISSSSSDHMKDLLDATYDGTLVNSPNVATGGVASNGSSSYSRLGVNLSTVSWAAQNNHCIGVFVSSSSGGSANVPMGDTNTFINPRTAGNIVTIRSASTSGANTVATVATAVGMTTISRTASGNVKVYKDAAVLNTVTLASSGLSNTELFGCCRNNGGSPISYSTDRVFAFFAGGNTVSDTDVANIYTLINNLKTALGA